MSSRFAMPPAGEGMAIPPRAKAHLFLAGR